MLLDQILIDEDFDAVEKLLLPVITSKSWVGQLQHVADVKTIEDRLMRCGERWVFFKRKGTDELSLMITIPPSPYDTT